MEKLSGFFFCDAVMLLMVDVRDGCLGSKRKRGKGAYAGLPFSDKAHDLETHVCPVSYMPAPTLAASTTAS